MDLRGLDSLAAIGWFVLTIVVLVFCWRRLRTPVGGSLRQALGIVAFGAPVACLLAEFYLFAARAHPVRQYNDGPGLGAWSAWVMLWPLLLLATFVGGLLAFGLAAREDRMRKRVTAWLLLAALNGFSFFGVLTNFPSA